MAVTDLPSPSELHKYLSYDPETGELRWKARTPEMFEGTERRTPERTCASWNARHAGAVAMTAMDSGGYRRGRLNSRGAIAHRVIFAMMTGEWPEADIDHLNGERTDNRWENLRAASRLENMRNQKRRATNTSGANGVYWSKATEKWVAQVNADGRQRNLGYFKSFDDAVAARARASREHGYSERHGVAT